MEPRNLDLSMLVVFAAIAFGSNSPFIGTLIMGTGLLCFLAVSRMRKKQMEYKQVETKNHEETPQ